MIITQVDITFSAVIRSCLTSFCNWRPVYESFFKSAVSEVFTLRPGVNGTGALVVGVVLVVVVVVFRAAGEAGAAGAAAGYDAGSSVISLSPSISSSEI
jgi:hypothetical protein